MRSGTNASPAGGKMNAAGGTENQNTYMVQQVKRSLQNKILKNVDILVILHYAFGFKNKDLIIHKYYCIYLV